MSGELRNERKRSPEIVEEVDQEGNSPKRSDYEEVEEVAVDTEISLPTTEVATEDSLSGKADYVVNRSGSPGTGGNYASSQVYSPSNMVNFQTNPAAINSALEMLMQMQQAISQKAGQPSQPSPVVAGQNNSDPESAPVYLMVPSGSQDYMQASRTLAPRRDGDPGNMKVVSDHEMQRKASHNEVERRRRERINELTRSLAKLIPSCQKESTTSGKTNLNKGFVLEKAIEHIKELANVNGQLTEMVKSKERAHHDLQVVQGQVTILEKENDFLRAQLKPSNNQQNLGNLIIQSLKSVNKGGDDGNLASALAHQMQMPTAPTGANGVPANASVSPSQSASVPVSSVSGSLFLAQSLIPQLVENKPQPNTSDKAPQKADSSEEAHIITTTT